MSCGNNTCCKCGTCYTRVARPGGRVFKAVAIACTSLPVLETVLAIITAQVCEISDLRLVPDVYMWDRSMTPCCNSSVNESGIRW
jgi:hypothetical protein